MAQGSLADYIKRQVKRGYSTDAIKESLLNAGYSSREISESIGHLNTQHRSLKSRGVIIAVIIGAFLAVAFVLSFFVLKPFSPAKSVELSLRPSSLELSQGQPLSFFKTLSSEKARKADIVIEHNVLNINTSEIVASKQESMTVAKESTTHTEIVLPELPPGRYALQTTITYDNKKAQKSFSFEVVEGTLPEEIAFVEEKPQVPDECSLGCDDFNSCTQDTCLNGKCSYENIVPCCGNGACEKGESVLNCAIDCSAQKSSSEELIEKAKSIPTINEATKTCNSIPDADASDTCFKEVALSSGISPVCSSIQSETKKDDCYIQFAYRNDFSVCGRITNRYLMNSCYSLARVKNLQSQTNSV